MTSLVFLRKWFGNASIENLYVFFKWQFFIRKYWNSLVRLKIIIRHHRGRTRIQRVNRGAIALWSWTRNAKDQWNSSEKGSEKVKLWESWKATKSGWKVAQIRFPYQQQQNNLIFHKFAETKRIPRISLVFSSRSAFNEKKLFIEEKENVKKEFKKTLFIS